MIVDGGPFGRPAFFPGNSLLLMWRRDARSGGAGTSRARGHTVFLLPDQGRLPSLVSTIHPIFVVDNSFHRIVWPLCCDTIHARPYATLYAGSPAACQGPVCHHVGFRCRVSVALSRRRNGVSAAEDFAQYQLRFVDDIQHDYEVIRPIVLFAETIAERSRQTGIELTVVGAKARRFAMEGMLGLVPALEGPPRPVRHERRSEEMLVP